LGATHRAQELPPFMDNAVKPAQPHLEVARRAASAGQPDAKAICTDIPAVA